MIEPNEYLKTVETYLADKRLELEGKKIEVLEFIETKHKAKEVQPYLDGLHREEIAFNKSMLPVLIMSQEDSLYQAKANELWKQANEVKEILKEIDIKLAEDFAQKQSEEKTDFVKSASLVTATSVAVWHIFREPPSIKNILAAGLGAGIGLLIVFHKNIGAAFVAGASATCAQCQKTKQSIADLHIGAHIITCAEKIVAPVRNEKSFVIVVSGNGRKAVKKLDAV